MDEIRHRKDAEKIGTHCDGGDDDIDDDDDSDKERKEGVERETYEKLVENSRESRSISGDHQETDAMTEEEDVRESPKSYVDKGYAWVIVSASFSAQFLLAGYLRASGVVFVEIQNQFRSSSSLTSLINGIQEALCSIFAFIFLGFVLKRTNARFLCLSGSVFLVVGVASNVFATSAQFLIGTHGALVGMAVGSLYSGTIIVLSDYFVARRALATSLVVTGSSLGGTVVPLVTRHLFDGYGFHRGFLLLGGIFAHCFVFSMLLTPVQYMEQREKKRDRRNASKAYDDFPDTLSNANQKLKVEIEYSDLRREPQNVDALGCANRHNEHEVASYVFIPNDEMHDSSVQLNTGGSYSPSINSSHFNGKHKVMSFLQGQDISPTKYFPSDHASLEQFSITTSKPLGAQSHDPSTNDIDSKQHPDQTDGSMSLLTKPDPIHGQRRGMSQLLLDFQSTLSLHSLADIRHVGDSSSGTKLKAASEEGQRVGCGGACRKFRHHLCGGELTRCAAFWALGAFFVFSWTGYMVPCTYIPALAKERGLTESDIAFFLVIQNALDLAARLLPGILVNTGRLRASTVCIGPMAACGIAGFFTPLLQSYEAVLGLVIVYGLFMGVYASMQSVIVVEVVGLRRYPSALAFGYLVMSLGTTASFPFAGFLKDVTGTYSTAYFFLSSVQLVAVGILVCLPALKRFDVRRGLLL